MASSCDRNHVVDIFCLGFLLDFLRNSCCSEEILNPSVPMALRLSGILMGEGSIHCYIYIWFALNVIVVVILIVGGVVIVYERKVKLLYGWFRLSLLCVCVF